MRKVRERLRELLLESELNRQAFHVEYGRIRCRVEHYRRGYQWAHAAWRWAVPLAGFLMARHLKATKGIFAKGPRLAAFVHIVWKLWEAWRNRGPRFPF